MRNRTIALTIALLICVPATCGLPVLKSDDAIQKGVLPNGISYYFATNACRKGMVDISLIQKADPFIPEDKLSSAARNRFASAGFPDAGTENFLSRNGILPDVRGYIHVRRGGIEYRFRDVSVSRGETVLDSLFTIVFRLAASTVGDVQPTTCQAVVVAGDFDSSELLSTMRTTSIWCPYRKGKLNTSLYVWNPDKYRDTKVTVREGRPAGVSVEWHSRRVPSTEMKTSLPAVAEKLAGEFGRVLKNRLYPAFRKEKLPVRLSFEYVGSGQCLGDESISLDINCRRNLCDKAAEILETELDRLCTYGIGSDEYAYAGEMFHHEWMMNSNARLNPGYNAALVSRCKSEFLYGASLAGDDVKMKSIYGKDVPEEEQLRLFNNYMQYLLSQTSRVDSSLAVPASRLPLDEVADRIRISCGVLTPVKMPKKDEPELLTGGVKWVLPGGVTVIYKEMESDGWMSWSYSSRGGRKYVREDSFASIADVSEDDFANYLSSRGINMETTLLPVDVRLSGTVPDDHFEDMLQTLVALTRQQENLKAFGPDCYKVLVLAGDMGTAAVKAILSRYALAFRPGVKWFAGEPVETEMDKSTPERPHIRDIRFQLDMNSENYVLSEMARYAFRDALATAFCGSGSYFIHNQDFIGFPYWHYRILYGVRRASLDGFVNGEGFLEDWETDSRLDAVLPHLASHVFSSSEVDAYRRMAADFFESYRETPAYYVDMAMNRYMDNRNYFNNIDNALKSQDKGSLHNFFQRAAYR